MPYCTRADIEAKIGADALLELADPENTGEVDDTTVTEAIADADSVIDGYCAGRYGVPFSPVPGVIKKLSRTISIYNLHEGMNKSLDAMSAERKAYEDAISYLKDISKGAATLGAATVPPATITESAGPSSVTLADNTFATKLKQGF